MPNDRTFNAEYKLGITLAEADAAAAQPGAIGALLRRRKRAFTPRTAGHLGGASGAPAFSRA